MPQLLLGILLLAGIWMAMRWFAETSPAGLVRGAKATVAVLALAVIALLIVTGRLGWALAGLAAMVPWAIRVAHLHRLWRTFSHRLAPASGPVADRSTVKGRFVEMSIDHQNQTLEGMVLDGPLAGRALSSLSRDEAMELYRQSAADLPSQRLLETWLERLWPDWRSGTGGTAESGNMDLVEAREILGVGSDATEEQIRAAHRRLIGKLHPDAGGSHYLAAKINRAKDVLLRE